MTLRSLSNSRVLLWAVAAVLACAPPAWAVVPGLAGPLQALAQMLPQILPFLLAALAGLFSVPAWRARLKRVGVWLSTPRGLLTACVGLGALTGAVYLLRGGDRSKPVAVSAAGGEKSGSDWPMFRADLRRTGAVAGTQGPAQPTIAWTFNDPETRVSDLSSSPAVVGQRLYIGSAQASVFDTTGMVYSLDAGTGKRVWQFQTERQVFSSPAVVNGRVYVGEGLHQDAGCNLYCLDARTGRKLWATPTKSHTESSPAVVNNRVYFGAGEDGVYCLDAGTGKVIWHTGGMHVDACPVVANGKVYVGTGYGQLRALALNAATGKVVWSTPCNLPVWGEPSVVGGAVYFGFGNGDFVQSNPNPRGGVWRLDAATGKQAWRRDLPDAVLTSLVVQGERVVLGCRDGKTYALELSTGKTVWSRACGGPVVSSPAADGASLYVAGSTGQIFRLDLATGKPAWALDLAAQTSSDVQLLSSPALANGRLYIGTSKGKVFCIGP